MRTQKRCSKCKKLKPLGAFYKSKKTPDRLYCQCKTCHKTNVEAYAAKNGHSVAEAARAWRAEHSDQIAATERKSRIKRKYGLTVEEYDDMLAKNCAICDCKPDRPHLDHCHKTGKVRDVLCHNCNLALGLLKDDPTIAYNAFAYLKRFRL